MKECIRLRSSLWQYGHADAAKCQRAVHRPQMSSRSPVDVSTANSGSPPQSGQCAWVHVEKSARCCTTSAHRSRNGRIASERTWSKASDETGAAGAGMAATRSGAATWLNQRTTMRLEGVAVARHRLNFVVVRRLERLEPPQDVGGLPEHETEVGPVERDVLEAEQRPALRMLRP